MKLLFVDTNIYVQRMKRTNKQTNKWNSCELLPNTFSQLWSHQLTITILRNDSGNNGSIHGNSSFLAKLKHVPNICQNIQDIYTSGNQYSCFLHLSLTPPFPFSLSLLLAFFFVENKDMEKHGHSKPVFYFSLLLCFSYLRLLSISPFSHELNVIIHFLHFIILYPKCCCCWAISFRRCCSNKCRPNTYISVPVFFHSYCYGE